ncbi:hypothetical protein J9332_34025 [Aquimarina celericrescens]|nr:hypothetical protein [Aquimarina celericrescens]
MNRIRNNIDRIGFTIIFYNYSKNLKVNKYLRLLCSTTANYWVPSALLILAENLEKAS